MRGPILKDILASPGPTFPGMLARQEHLAAIGPLDESVISYQEWDTAIRLASVTEFAFVPEPTFVYDMRGADAISRNRRRTATGYEQVVRKHRQRILHVCGPAAMANHLRVAARLWFEAGETPRAWSRLVTAAAVWPFAVNSLASTIVLLTRPER